MFRQLSNLILAVSLLAGGWGYALAAAFCGHPGCAHSAVTAGHDVRPPASVDAGAEAAHGEHLRADAHAEHSGHESAAAGHLGHDVSEGPSPAADRGEPHPAPPGSLMPGRTPCGHCVGGPGPLRTAVSKREADRPQRQDYSFTAPQSFRQSLPDAVFVREVIPSQGAPPGRVSTHVLNSVFRI